MGSGAAEVEEQEGAAAARDDKQMLEDDVPWVSLEVRLLILTILQDLNIL